MKTPQTKPKQGGQGSMFNWRCIAMLAVLACVIIMAGRATAGTLTVSMAPLSQAIPVNMSAEGDLDWAHYGLYVNSGYDHKAGVTERIGNPSQSGTSANFTGAAALCSWVDGTLDQTVAGTASGSYIYPAGSAYQWSIPASTVPVVLHLYVSTYQGGGDLTFTLSDGSAPAVTTNVGTNVARRVTVTFAANSAAQTLTVEYAVSTGTGNNIALMGATLSSAASLPLSVPPPQLSSGSALAAGSTFTVKSVPTGVTVDGASTNIFQWQVSYNGGAYADIAGGTNYLISATAPTVGSYNYRVIVTNSAIGGGAVTSAPATVAVSAPTSTLSVGSDVLPAASDVNLSAVGVTDWAHWGVGGPVYDYKTGTIGNYTQIGADAPGAFASSVSFSWTNATSANNPVAATTEAVGLATGNGFQLNIPASTTTQLVFIYVGVNNAKSQVQFSLSDNTAPSFLDTPATTIGTLRYSMAFGASTSGKTLIVKVTGTARTANEGTVSLLAAALQPVPPLSVAPLVVDPDTAVLASQPMVITATAYGSPPFSYVWQVDTGAGYVNLPATGSSASFLARSTPGTESCRVIVSGSQGSVTSAPVVLTTSAATGTLKLLTVDLTPSSANLTREGSLDWSHWGSSAVSAAFDQKAIGGNPLNLIGDYTNIGGSSSLGNYGSGVTYTWTDGTPTLASTNTRGVYRYPAGNGFALNVAAATTNRLLHVYVGSYQAVGHVEAYLSDNSALKLISEAIPWGGNGRYNIQFAAGSPGQTLVFKYWFNSGGNVTFSAASLEGMPLLVVGTPTVSPTNTVPAGSSITLQAQGANGVPPLHYQWQLDSGSGYVAILSSDTASLTTSVGASLGGKNYRVAVSDISGSVTSAPVAVTVTAATSTLVGLSANLGDTPTTVDLTAEGSIDWNEYGYLDISTIERKFPLAGQIGDWTFIGTGTTNRYGGNMHYTWTDGTPDPVANTGQGLYINGAGNGFQETALATLAERVFTVYCGVYQATMHVEAMMSDNSAPIYIDETLSNGSGTSNGRLRFKYSSPNPGAYLIVRHWDKSGANTTLQATSLQNYVPVVPGSVQVQAVEGGQLQLTWTAGSLLEAPTVNGPWTANSAASPYTFTPTGAQKYFRTEQSPF